MKTIRTTPGWPFTEAKGRFLGEVFNIIEGEKRQPAFNRALPAIAENRDVGLVANCVLICRDGFESINDSLGHAIGDQLLQSVAGRLAASVRAMSS